jgi:hypothetical protein
MTRVGSGLVGHQPHQLPGGRVAVTGGVDQQGELLVGDLGEATVAGQLDLGLAPPGHLRGVGAGAGVQQREPVDPPGGLADDLEADVAAHRQPGQGEAGWSVGQDAGGDGGDGVVAGVVGDGWGCG